jgi:type IV pilus assembly protein PilY1
MNRYQFLCASLGVFIAVSASSVADDTDLYLNPVANNVRNQILIIFDNSGSMDTIVEDAPGGYDPDYKQADGTLGYPAIGSSNSYSGRMIYFTNGTGMDQSSLPVPDSPSESRRFNDLINGCKVAREALNKYGRFSGYFREYITKGNGKNTWQPVKQNSGAEKNNPIDCWEDIESSESSNNKDGTVYQTAYDAGYPQDGVANAPWSNNSDALENAKNLAWNNGELMTLYTDNYLRWYTAYKAGMLDDSGSDQTRLEIAKTAISGVISTIPSVDFGLAVFNLNFPNEGDSDGGRIVAGIQPRTLTEKSLLIDTLVNLPANTNTPLCETLFEAYKYFSGGTITFGHSDKDNNQQNYKANEPPYDTSIEKDGSSYTTPLSECNKVAHIIYITDGAPTLDDNANAKIKLLNDDPFVYKAASGANTAKSSYLPALAEYMFTNDLLPNVDNKQSVITHTIGFNLGADSEAEPLLIETAARSYQDTSNGREVLGTYSSADDVLGLEEALSNIIASIPKIGQRFSAPGVAFSSADPTRTSDSAYYAIFRPQQSPKWAGNLKKLKVNSAGTLVDAQGLAAIDSSGGISESACTLWSNCSVLADGNEVERGGAARQIDPDNRTLLSDIGTAGSLVDLNLSNASSYAGGDTQLATHLGLASSSPDISAKLANTFEWIKGKNVDKDSEGEFTSTDFAGVRGDIMGDALHSQPLAIDYGGDKGVLVFVGTNHGVLHAFLDSGDSVSEEWAFMPYNLLPNIAELRRNSYQAGHSAYGLDGSPVAYIERGAGGIITKAWLFIGMRRGGNSYYAFDVTTPDNPSLMWKISSDTSSFNDMGQTWSTPVILKVPGSDAPVIAFGGGYNVGYDANNGANSVGRMVYLVDAESGTLVHSFGSNGTSSLPNISNSIVGSIATLDSNNDGYSDRLYAADLGGDIWRMDMPSSDKSKWSGFKFAELGDSALAEGRMFFYEPTIAQTSITNTFEVSSTGTLTTTTKQNIPYDAVTIGSGNRADPLNLTAQDMFFVLQDRNVITKQFGTGGTTIPAPLKLANLYDVSSSTPTTQTELIEFGNKRGWFYDFATTGEKSLSPSLIIKGKVYFTSFTPSTPDTAICSVSSVGRLYTLDLHKGLRYSNTTEYIDVCDNCIPQPPKLITPPAVTDDDGNIIDLPDPRLIIGKGICDDNEQNCTGTIEVDAALTTNKIYYHLNENN